MRSVKLLLLVLILYNILLCNALTPDIISDEDKDTVWHFSNFKGNYVSDLGNNNLNRNDEGLKSVSPAALIETSSTERVSANAEDTLPPNHPDNFAEDEQNTLMAAPLESDEDDAEDKDDTLNESDDDAVDDDTTKDLDDPTMNDPTMSDNDEVADDDTIEDSTTHENSHGEISAAGLDPSNDDKQSRHHHKNHHHHQHHSSRKDTNLNKKTRFAQVGSQERDSIEFEATKSSSKLIQHDEKSLKKEVDKVEKALNKKDQTKYEPPATKLQNAPLSTNLKWKNVKVKANSKAKPMKAVVVSQEEPAKPANTFRATKLSKEKCGDACKTPKGLQPVTIVNQLSHSTKMFKNPNSAPQSKAEKELQDLNKKDPMVQKILKHIERMHQKIIDDGKWILNVQKLLRFYSQKQVQVRAGVRQEAQALLQLKRMLAQRMKHNADQLLKSRLGKVNAKLSTVQKTEQQIRMQSSKLQHSRAALTSTINRIAQRMAELRTRNVVEPTRLTK